MGRLCGGDGGELRFSDRTGSVTCTVIDPPVRGAVCVMFCIVLRPCPAQVDWQCGEMEATEWVYQPAKEASLRAAADGAAAVVTSGAASLEILTLRPLAATL